VTSAAHSRFSCPAKSNEVCRTAVDAARCSGGVHRSRAGVTSRDRLTASSFSSRCSHAAQPPLPDVLPTAAVKDPAPLPARRRPLPAGGSGLARRCSGDRMAQRKPVGQTAVATIPRPPLARRRAAQRSQPVAVCDDRRLAAVSPARSRARPVHQSISCRVSRAVTSAAPSTTSRRCARTLKVGCHTTAVHRTYVGHDALPADRRGSARRRTAPPVTPPPR
jgi:hypothetical protein